jgi:hypothetical protein
MQVVVRPRAAPVQLGTELNSSKSRTGLREMMYYLEYKIGLNPFCFAGLDLTKESVPSKIRSRYSD